MVAVTAPISSFSSSGPSVEWCMPICCTILIVLPEEVVKLRNAGSVGLLASTPIAETMIMETGMSISNTLNVLHLGVSATCNLLGGTNRAVSEPISLVSSDWDDTPAAEAIIKIFSLIEEKYSCLSHQMSVWRMSRGQRWPQTL